MAPYSARGKGPRRSAPCAAALALLLMVAGAGAAAAGGTTGAIAGAPPGDGADAPALRLAGGEAEAARPDDAAFTVFNQYIEDLTPRIAEALGEAPFTAVENLGVRTVRLTASETWVAGSVRQRRSNAMMLYNLWRLANARQAVKIIIVNQDGVDEVIIQDTARGLHIRIRQ